jgi:hypothetical protein
MYDDKPHGECRLKGNSINLTGAILRWRTEHNTGSQMTNDHARVQGKTSLLDDRFILSSSVQMMSEIFSKISKKTNLQPADIVIMFGLISASAQRTGALDVTQDLDDDYHWISLMSLSQLVSINRTTLRRRALALQDQGFLACDPSKGVRLITGAMSDPSLHRILSQAALKHVSRIQAYIDQRHMPFESDRNDHLQR